MKRFIIIALALFLSTTLFAQQNGDTIISNNPQKVRLRVLYFHIEHRCNTCHSIEKYVRKTLFENFQSQIDNGFIDLSILNCEDPKNAEISKKYDAYGATLAITPYDANGQELKSEDLTGWAFKTIGNPELFISQLKEKITAYLK
jgi:hypothetical protein